MDEKMVKDKVVTTVACSQRHFLLGQQHCLEGEGAAAHWMACLMRGIDIGNEDDGSCEMLPQKLNLGRFDPSAVLIPSF